MKFFKFLSLILVSYSFAQDIPVPQDDIYELHVPLDHSLDNNQILSSSLTEESDLLMLQYNYSNSVFKQQGVGQNYESKSGMGHGFEVASFRSLGERKSMHIRGQFNQAVFSEPQNIGSKNVAVTRAKTSFNYAWHFGKKSVRWMVEAGLMGSVQKSDNFSTNYQLIPFYWSVGPEVIFAFKFPTTKNLSIQTSLLASLPLLYRELELKSGVFKYGVNSRVDISLIYKISHSWALASGIFLEYEKLVFEGVGERSVSNAKNIYYNLTFPLGISYEF